MLQSTELQQQQQKQQKLNIFDRLTVLGKY